MIQRTNRTVIAIGVVAGVLATSGLCGFFSSIFVQDKPVPIPIGPNRVTPQVALGRESIYVLAADGTFWGLGKSQAGLWTGLAAQPCQIGIEADWKTIAVGGTFTAALKTNGTLWRWGYVGTKQTGQVGSETNWVGMAAGASHQVALRKNGTLWAWGNNNEGQLGIRTKGPSASYSTPILGTDGSLWGWGWSPKGEIGNGTIGTSYHPTRMDGRTDWIALGARSGASAGLSADGTLWGWGEHHWKPPRLTWRYKISRILSGVGIKVNWGPRDSPAYSATPVPIARFYHSLTNY